MTKHEGRLSRRINVASETRTCTLGFLFRLFCCSFRKQCDHFVICNFKYLDSEQSLRRLRSLPFLIIRVPASLARTADLEFSATTNDPAPNRALCRSNGMFP